MAAYGETEYWVGEGPTAFCLRVDKHSPDLATLLDESGQTCAAFITAFNPCSDGQRAHTNHAAHEALRQELGNCGAQVIDGTGRDASGDWPEESSFLAVGLGLAASKKVGNRFGQNAIVWSDSDAVPRLILLR